VTALVTEGNKLISAAKDGKIAIISIGTGGNFKLEKTIDLSGVSTTLLLNQNLNVKSLDFYKNNLLIGLKNGTILEYLSIFDVDLKDPRII
jgi:hypothetical protein